MKPIIQYLMLLLGMTAMADTIQYVQLDNQYNVWTKRVGHGPIKILTLHGGPGCSGEYIEAAFEAIFPPEEFEIIYYDQLGSYRSDHPDDLSLWTVERFREEVEQVRKALNLQDFYLYGQSWGAMLAIEYALKYQHHLKGLILSNSPGSIASYEEYIRQLCSKLPLEVQAQMQIYEENQEFTHPAYQKLLFDHLYSRHMCRLEPWPKGAATAFDHINETVYHTMQGPSEITIIGNYCKWNRWDDFPTIKVRSLVISGRYDTINPEDTLKIARLIPNATAKICEVGSHLSLYDDSESYFEAMLAFLRDR
jgi:proline iminopeptidase